MTDNPDVAFALSGGGSLGAVQVGMVQALYERGIVPQLLVGTSAGAINSAFLAAREPTVAAAEELAEVWRGLRRAEVFPVQARGVLGFLGARPYLVQSDGLRAIIDKHIPLPRLEDAVIPVVAIATDLLSGREVELRSGPTVEAVLASAAIPGVYPPVRWEDHVLIDGGVSNNTPLSPALQSGAKTVYVLPSGSACGLGDVPHSAIGVLMHSLSLLVMRRLIMEVDEFQGSTRLIVLPPPCPLDVQAVDFSEADQLIRRGREGAHQYLDRVDSGDVVPPLHLVMHSHRAHASS